MDATAPRRRPVPPVLELIEPPRGLGFTVDELEEAIRAIDDRAEYAAEPGARARLRRAGVKLERELARLVAI